MMPFSRLGVRLPATTIGLALLSAAAMGAFSWSAAKSEVAYQPTYYHLKPTATQASSCGY